MTCDKAPSTLYGNLLFPHIFRTFRMAIQPAKLLLAFAAVVDICIVGTVMDLIWRAVRPEENAVFHTLARFASARFHTALQSLWRFDLSSVATEIKEMLLHVLWVCRYYPVYSVVFFTLVLVVMSLAGGAICRIATVQFAGRERPSLVEALRFSMRKLVSFVAAPLAPLAIIVVIGMSVILLGFVGNIPVVGEFVVGLGLPFVFVAGALIAVVGIGAAAGLNLMFPAIAFEDSDSFDAISRSFSYVYARPWRMALYSAITAVYGAICYEFVRLFTFVVLWASYRFLGLGIMGDNVKLRAIWPAPTLGNLHSWPDTTELTGSLAGASYLVGFWVLVVVGLLAAFLLSFYFCGNTVIYALMRHRVDRTALDDIYLRESEADSGPGTVTSDSANEAEPAESDSAQEPSAE